MDKKNYRYVVTAFIGKECKLEFQLDSFEKEKVFFGRDTANDIVLPSEIVSARHGWFSRGKEGWSIHDSSSTNGTWFHDKKVEDRELSDGDTFFIGSDSNPHKVVLTYSVQTTKNTYQTYKLNDGGAVFIGRSSRCQIVLPHMSVSRIHGKIISVQGKHYLEDCGSTNGIWLNGKRLTGRCAIHNADRILISDTQFIYSDNTLYYRNRQDGMGVTAAHVFKTVGKGRKKKVINEDISLTINPCEFVAIVGGSGAGKSTLLNCLSGCSGLSGGQVMINGESLADNYDSLKYLIGYVPQQDIVYDKLTLRKMLSYTAQIRMPSDTGKEERENRIRQVIHTIGLEGHEDTPIENLSGGQRKRASIAVELLADPKLFFLDEPTSGLDPGTERSLMEFLQKMTAENKTVILVTHNTLNLHLCSKVIFLGYGGKLCFCGSPEEALAFFGVEGFVEIYNLISENPGKWEEAFKKSKSIAEESIREDETAIPGGRRRFGRAELTAGIRQFRVLSARFLELTARDTNRLLLLLLMPPGLGLLLCLAFAASYPFEAAKDTMSFVFALSCCAFWVGLFNAIQEICKERVIFRRERMAVLQLLPYMGSKILILGVLCILQSLLLTGTVTLAAGCPAYGTVLKSQPFLEMFITTFLTMISAMTLGLLVSAVSGNSDRAVATAPILLVPQILFSGIACELSGFGKKISWFITCRWACTAYCTSADVNNLPSEISTDLLGSKIDGDTVMVSMEYAFDRLEGLNPVGKSWLILLVFSIACVAGGIIYLKFGKKDIA